MTDEDVSKDVPAENPDAAVGEGGPEPREDHHVKAEIRGVIGKVAGIAVEAGSMLAGNAGAGVSAEGEVAEHDTEDLVDRIDGEG